MNIFVQLIAILVGIPILLAVGIAILFLVCVVIRSKVTKTSHEESSKFFINFIRDSWKGINTKPKPILRLGTYDGANIVLDKINDDFKGVADLFKTFIYQECQDLSVSANPVKVMIYTFKAKHIHVETEPLVLLDLIQSIVEEKVAEIKHSYNDFTPTYSQVAVEYNSSLGLLQIAVAMNEDGFAFIEQEKARINKEVLSFDDAPDTPDIMYE